MRRSRRVARWRLFADLELAHGDGRFAKLFGTLTKVDLLILDDGGPDRLPANHRRDLMEIVWHRYGRSRVLEVVQRRVVWRVSSHRSARLASQRREALILARCGARP